MSVRVNPVRTRFGIVPPGRLLKKSAAGVLASRRGSTYGTEYASPLCSLRPCRSTFLSSLLMSCGRRIAQHKTFAQGEANRPFSSRSSSFPLHFLVIEFQHLGDFFLRHALLYPLVALMAEHFFGHLR